MERYIIQIKGEPRPVAMLYNPHMKHRQIKIGSYDSSREFVERLCKVYFVKDVYGKDVRETYPQPNKLAFQWKIEPNDFRKAVEAMRKAGISVRATASLGRIMR
jgi:hypothetical protein